MTDETPKSGTPSEPDAPSKKAAGDNNWVQIAIAAIGAISATVIGYWQFAGSNKNPVTTSPDEFVGRVVDAETEDQIRRAKIILEGEGIPPEMYTDSAGVFKFPLESAGAVRLRVEAEGYEKYDRLIDPAANSGIEQIQLKPLLNNTPGQTSSEAVNASSISADDGEPAADSDITGVWEHYSIGNNGELIYLSKVRLVKEDDTYLASILDQVTSNGIINSIAVTNITYDGQTLTFQSSWDNGAAANFRMEKLSDTIFEGETRVNGQLVDRSRLVKIQ